MKNRPFLFQIAANHTNDHDLLLLAIFIRGEDGYDKHKIIDRPLSQNNVSSTFATGCRFAWCGMYESLPKGFIINRNCNKYKMLVHVQCMGVILNQ